MTSSNSPSLLPSRWRWLAHVMLFLFVLIVAIGQYGGIFVDMGALDLSLAVPYLLGRGLHYYDQIFLFHPPLYSWLISLAYQINPDPLTNIRLLNVFAILGSMLLVTLAARRNGSTGAGIVGAVFFGIWSFSYNTPIFYIDLIAGVLAIIILYLGTFRRSLTVLVSIGICAGIAAALKQNQLVILGAPLLWVLLVRESWQKALKEAILVVMPAGAIFLGQYAFLAAAGVWDEAILSLFNPGNAAWVTEVRSFFDGHAFRTISLTLVFVPGYFLCLRGAAAKQRSVGMLALLLFGFTMLLNFPTPGYYHMTGSLPIVAFMSGFAIYAMLKQSDRNRSMPAFLTVGVLIASAVNAFSAIFTLADGRANVVGWDEFQPVSEWIAANTQPDETILILPTYDTNGNIYAQAERLPPFFMKTWSYHAEVLQNAERLQDEIAAAPPDLIVLFSTLYGDVEANFPQLNLLMEQEYRTDGQIDDVLFQGEVIFLRYEGGNS